MSVRTKLGETPRVSLSFCAVSSCHVSSQYQML